jgi:hypothetical protein
MSFDHFGRVMNGPYDYNARASNTIEIILFMYLSWVPKY